MTRSALFTDAAGYLFTNRVHIFVMPVVLTLFWNLAERLPLPFSYYLMISCTTAGGYIYNMLTDGAEDAVNYPSRYRLFRPGARSQAVVAACFAAGFLLSLRAGLAFVLYGGLVNFLGGLYGKAIPLGPSGKVFRIKSVPLLKNVYASLFWSVALVLTPYLYVGQRPPARAALFAAIGFGLTFFVELLWDLRDVDGDRAAGVRTLPIAIGVGASEWVLRGLHLATCLLSIGGVWAGWLPAAFLISVVHLPCGLIFLEWYRRLPEKELASHAYVMYAGALMVGGLAWPG
jgi:4-hydroxybenzoate polyprenyltransferase